MIQFKKFCKRTTRTIASLLLVMMLAMPLHATASSFDFKNYQVSRVAVTIENDVFSMAIPANAPYYADIEKKVLDYCAWVQAATGLSFHPLSTSYAKISITNDGGHAYGGSFGVNLQDMDYLLDVGGASYVYLHELTHTLQYRLVQIDCQPFAEAFAILTSAKVAKEQGDDYLYWHLMSDNYAYVDPASEKDIVSSPAFETFYRTNDDGWDNYLYGFRFGVYLEITYDPDILSTIIKNFAAEAGTRSTTRDAFVDFIKTQTDADVFEDFVNWYWKNKKLFDQQPPPPQKGDPLAYMPIINEYYQGYSVTEEVSINGTATLDFTDSHAYAQFKGYCVNGIGASVYAKKALTIEAYDQKGGLLETKSITAKKSTNVFFADAAYLVITCDADTIRFSPDFERCYSK